MGGIGSGGSRYAGRYTTNESCELSLSFLRKRGALRGQGATGMSQWTSGGRPIASIGWATSIGEHSQLQLAYTYNRTGEPPKTISEAFALTSTRPHLGGVRWWIRCRCWRRVAKIYKPPGAHLFRCRECYRLSYASRNESAEWRAFRRLKKLSLRLDPLGDVAPIEYLDGYSPPLKPKGMRWRTYDRLVRAAEFHAANYRHFSLVKLTALLSRPLPGSLGKKF